MSYKLLRHEDCCYWLFWSSNINISWDIAALHPCNLVTLLVLSICPHRIQHLYWVYILVWLTELGLGAGYSVEPNALYHRIIYNETEFLRWLSDMCHAFHQWKNKTEWMHNKTIWLALIGRWWNIIPVIVVPWSRSIWVSENRWIRSHFVQKPHENGTSLKLHFHSKMHIPACF